MSQYKSVSLHKPLSRCRSMVAAAVAGITAAAIPLALCGIGTVGVFVFRLSKLSAAAMQPMTVSASSLASVKPQAETPPAPQKSSPTPEETKPSAPKQASGEAETPPQDTSDAQKRGAVKEMRIKNTGDHYGNVYVKDGNANYDADIPQLLRAAAKCRIRKNAGYQVLLIHTHTTESYADSAKDWYDKSVNPRTTDKSESVVAVADEIEKKLNAAGIRTLHVTTYHDYPEYTGAYNRARETIKSYLAKYPSIEMVIDVHRDAMAQKDGTKIKPTVTIDGKKAAQVMIITGCDNDGSLHFDGWRKNLIMATQLQKQLADDYDGLARPLYFAPYRYNMDLTPNSLLIEFGTDVNTLSEAKYSGRMVGSALVKVLERYVVGE